MPESRGKREREKEMERQRERDRQTDRQRMSRRLYYTGDLEMEEGCPYAGTLARKSKYLPEPE
jgi:hypothetical protein